MNILSKTDPSDWDSTKIRTWLKWSTEQFKLDPKPMFERFPKTGTELINMGQADFWVCAGSRRGGQVLARFILDWNHKACGRWLEHLHAEIDPCKLPRFTVM